MSQEAGWSMLDTGGMHTSLGLGAPSSSQINSARFMHSSTGALLLSRTLST